MHACMYVYMRTICIHVHMHQCMHYAYVTRYKKIGLKTFRLPLTTILKVNICVSIVFQILPIMQLFLRNFVELIDCKNSLCRYSVLYKHVHLVHISPVFSCRITYVHMYVHDVCTQVCMHAHICICMHVRT